MTGRDRLHRDRCGTVSIDPDQRPDDNHPNDPPDDFSRPDLYDPYGAIAAPRWVDGRLSPEPSYAPNSLSPGGWPTDEDGYER
jgi:hypothetical protein